MKAILSTVVVGIMSFSTNANQENTKPVTMPMQFTQYGHVMVDAQLNNADTVPMVLDTAATSGVISNSLLNELALPESALEKEEVTSATSKMTLTQANVNKTRVGHTAVMDLPYITQDLTVLKTAQGKVPGILGYGFLEKHCTVLDFVKSEVTFYAQTCSEQVTHGLKSQAFWLDEEFIKFNVEFNGHNVDAVLDTGAPINIINSHLLAKLDVEKKDKEDLKGLHGKAIQKQKLGEVSFNIGEHTVTSANTTVSDMPVFKKLGYENKPVILMGLADFKGGKLVIDYQAKHIYF